MDHAATPTAGVATIHCPVCGDHRLLERFAAGEAAPPTLRFCPGCYGFLVPKNLLANGFRERDTSHPAFRAAPVALRCKLCGGHLRPDGACAVCSAAPAPIECPCCGSGMQRAQLRQVWLDLCPDCGASWFDTGELAQVYGLEPVPGVALWMNGEDTSPVSGGTWQRVLQTVVGLVLGR